jgi:hypothetical protein
MFKNICVIDGRGGGIGASIIKYLRAEFEENIELLALGTNVIATSQMLRAGANKGGSGENAICLNAAKADCIVGTISITWANSMLGELTPNMARAVTSSPAVKILIPLCQEPIEIIGTSDEPLPHLLEKMVKKIKEMIKNV